MSKQKKSETPVAAATTCSASSWLPIESAPTDVDILIYSPKYGIAHVSWNEFMGRRRPDASWEGGWDSCFNNSDGYGDANFSDATFWMPLPIVPNAKMEQPAPTKNDDT